jgi:hypothetical protein
VPLITSYRSFNLIKRTRTRTHSHIATTLLVVRLIQSSQNRAYKKALYWDSHNYWPRSARVFLSTARVNNCGNLSACALTLRVRAISSKLTCPNANQLHTHTHTKTHTLNKCNHSPIAALSPEQILSFAYDCQVRNYELQRFASAGLDLVKLGMPRMRVEGLLHVFQLNESRKKRCLLVNVHMFLMCVGEFCKKRCLLVNVHMFLMCIGEFCHVSYEHICTCEQACTSWSFGLPSAFVPAYPLHASLPDVLNISWPWPWPWPCRTAFQRDFHVCQMRIWFNLTFNVWRMYGCVL